MFTEYAVIQSFFPRNVRKPSVKTMKLEKRPLHSLAKYTHFCMKLTASCVKINPSIHVSVDRGGGKQQQQ